MSSKFFQILTLSVSGLMVNQVYANQHATPVTFTYQKNNVDVGLKQAYIISENKTPDLNGRVATWSDVSLTGAYTAFPVRLDLAMNLPTGKAKLSGSQKNAIMDGNLVWQTRFGEGFNMTSGVNVAHSFSDKHTVGLGVSYGYRGKFDPNGDVEKDEIKLGNEWNATAQYTLNTTRVRLDTSLSYKQSGVTKRGGQDYYRKGALWSADVQSSFSLTPKQNVSVGYGYSYRKKDKYINNLTGDLEVENFNSNGSSHFVNASYGHRLTPRSMIRATADYLKIGQNSYDQINVLYVPARKKWSIGGQYSQQIGQNLNASVSVKRFKMKDNASPYLPKQDYKGWNMYATLQYQF